MRTLLPGTAAVLASGEIGLVSLVLMQFPTGDIALNTSTFDLEWGGVLYRGANALGSISEIQDGPGEIKGLSLQLSGVDSAYIALALDDSAIVQGTQLTIRTGIATSAGVLVDAPFAWTGRLDTMSIEENGETCTIQVTAESSGVDLLRGGPLVYNDGDQRTLYPGDRGMEYVTPQANVNIVWPSAQWAIARGPR